MIFKPKTKTLEIDGQTIILRKWTFAERLDFVDWAKGKEDKIEPLMEKVLMLSVADEQGKPVLKPEDWQELRQQDGEALQTVCEEAMNFNGLTGKEAIASAKKN